MDNIPIRICGVVTGVAAGDGDSDPDGGSGGNCGIGGEGDEDTDGLGGGRADGCFADVSHANAAEIAGEVLRSTGEEEVLPFFVNRAGGVVYGE